MAWDKGREIKAIYIRQENSNNCFRALLTINCAAGPTVIGLRNG
jgi:hypothetical protein